MKKVYEAMEVQVAVTALAGIAVVALLIGHLIMLNMIRLDVDEMTHDVDRVKRTTERMDERLRSIEYDAGRIKHNTSYYR